MKILNHLVLAFIFITQALMFAGCTQHMKVFECKADCGKNVLECKASVDSTEITIPN